MQICAIVNVFVYLHQITHPPPLEKKKTVEFRPGSRYTKLLVVSREIQVFFVRGFVGGGGQQSRMEGKVVWAVYVCDSVLCVRVCVCVCVCVGVHVHL